MISRFAGLVPIKMFDSSQVFNFAPFGANYATWGFDANSVNAVLTSAATAPAPGLITKFSNETMGVFGKNSLEHSPVGQTINTTSNQVSLTTSVADLFSPPHVELFMTGPAARAQDFNIYYRSVPPTPGIFEALPISFITVAGTGGLGTGFSLVGPGPFYQFGVNLFSTNQQDLFPGVLTYPTATPVDCIPQIIAVDPNILPPQLIPLGNPGQVLPTGAVAAFDSSQVLACPILGQPNNEFSNTLFIEKQTSNNIVIYWASDFATGNLVSSLQNINMDNVFLDSLFQHLGSPFIQSFRNGFIFPLITNGAGITGQYCEVCVFTSDMSMYYILQLEPQDDESALQLITNNVAPHHPQVKIDKNGIVWFNSGNPLDISKVLFSFSSGFQFPTNYVGNLQPITLPCFVDTMANGLYA